MYKRQIRKLYLAAVFESFALGNAAWVALLAQRGYSIGQIGILEAIFHVVSLSGEIPSGVMADVIGRKKVMVLSRIMSLLSALAMIFSRSFWGIAIAVGINALSYNLASGTREALAYESLKNYGKESEYNRFSATEMMIYRIGTACSTLLAGFSLMLGYRKAYSLDVIFGIFGVMTALRLSEMAQSAASVKEGIRMRCKACVTESILFLKKNPNVIGLILINSFVGAVSTLLLFFLQAKLPETGLTPSLLGPSLFFMQMGAALGAKLVQYCSRLRFRGIVIFSISGIAAALGSLVPGNPYMVIAGGFMAAFFDDFMEVRADIILNEKVPSQQRSTLISVSSFSFSVIMIILSPFMGWVFDRI